MILLGHDGSRISANQAAERWLDELRGPTETELPIEIRAVAARLRRSRRGDPGAPQLRIRTRAGRWAVMHASWMPVHEQNTVAVIIDQATSEQLAPLVMNVYGLTHQERAIAALVSQGSSTAEISGKLRITEHTVQDHLKSIFEKTGVRSRLRARVAGKPASLFAQPRFLRFSAER